MTRILFNYTEISLFEERLTQVLCVHIQQLYPSNVYSSHTTHCQDIGGYEERFLHPFHLTAGKRAPTKIVWYWIAHEHMFGEMEVHLNLQHIFWLNANKLHEQG